MRVISGLAGGRRLFSPDGDRTRPTTDRMKENLFNIIAGMLPDACFLDIFSGTGAIGIEALSRGAASAVFMDSSALCADIIKKNLQLTGLSENAKIINADYRKALGICAADGRQFDIVFMDPPYGRGLAEQAAAEVINKNLLKDDGLMIAEISGMEPIPSFDTRIEISRIRQYGTTTFLFMRKAAQKDDCHISGQF